MSHGDAVRSKINTIELTLKETDWDTRAGINAIVDVLKQIAKALDGSRTSSRGCKI